MRWPDGFMCPKCSGRAHSYYAARRLFQCTACRVQTSVRAGTIFHKSTTPLTKWFLAIHLITSSKNDIASLELSRQLDVKWDTAWLIKQKLMEVMRERNATYKLAGDGVAVPVVRHLAAAIFEPVMKRNRLALVA